MSGFHYTELSKTGSILLNAEEKDELFGYIDRLKAENEKLRELCGLMFVRLNTLVDDRWCPVFPGDEMTPYDVFDRYDELVQMGIEVGV